MESASWPHRTYQTARARACTCTGHDVSRTSPSFPAATWSMRSGWLLARHSMPRPPSFTVSRACLCSSTCSQYCSRRVRAAVTLARAALRLRPSTAADALANLRTRGVENDWTATLLEGPQRRIATTFFDCVRQVFIVNAKVREGCVSCALLHAPRAEQSECPAGVRIPWVLHVVALHRCGRAHALHRDARVRRCGRDPVLPRMAHRNCGCADCLSVCLVCSWRSASQSMLVNKSRCAACAGIPEMLACCVASRARRRCATVHTEWIHIARARVLVRALHWAVVSAARRAVYVYTLRLRVARC